MTGEKRSTINVRLGEDLLQKMRLAAAQSGHSMNAEIVQRLESSLADAQPILMQWDPWPALPKTQADIEDQIEHIRRNIAGMQLNTENILLLNSDEFTPERAKGTIAVLTEMVRQNWDRQIKEMEDSIQVLTNKLEWVRRTRPQGE